MIDLRTLMVLLAVADLMLAAALWIGAGRHLRDGLSQWAASLVVRAIACGFLAWNGSPPGAATVGAALLALSATLQVGAMLRFDRRELPTWVHSAVIAAIAVPLQLLEGETALRLLFGGVMLGTVLMVAAAIAAQLALTTGSRVRAVLVASFLVAGLAFAIRGIASSLIADPVRELLAPSGLAAAFALAAFAAALASTLGFLLLHNERADGEALRLATIDPLTGAYNRRTFHEIVQRELSRARRAGQPLSIVMMDIDHFRAINEQHGVIVGDQVLAEFAAIVRAALRKEDMLVRYGGEEFLVMLPDVPGPGAVVVAGRIRRAVAGAPVECEAGSFALTVSLGVAARLDEGPESIDGLLARADSALALAKQRGRNRVVALSLGRSIAA